MAERTTRRRLFFDIETSPNIGLFWEAGYKKNIDYSNIVKERAIICICYKWEDDKEVEGLYWDSKQNDKKMLEKFKPLAKKHKVVIYFSDELNDCAETPHVVATANLVNLEDLKEIITVRASAQEAAIQKGMQAAWVKSAGKKFNSNLSVPELPEDFVKVGKELYKGSNVVDAINHMAQIARTSKAADKTRMGKGFDTKAPQVNMRIAVNSLAMMVFGMLSHKGAITKQFSNHFLQNKDVTPVVRDAAETLLANIDELHEVGKTLMSQRPMSDESKIAIEKILTRSMIYGDNRQREEVDKQLNKNLQK